MALPFEFATATRIIFGRGAAQSLGSESRKLGSRAFLVTGGNSERAAAKTLLQEQGHTVTVWQVAGEPSTLDIQAGTALAREHRCDLVVATGGGSVIDAGKAVAAMLANPGELFDYLEIVGAGKPLPRAAAPFIAIPTTAGTGSEVTRNAVLSACTKQEGAATTLKVSLRSAGMLPRLAIIDPCLTKDLPPGLTATTGMDALTQLIEPFVCARANPLTDALCREGLLRAAHALPLAFEDGRNMDAREDMCVASLFGGMALANAGLGAVHGFAGPMGGMFRAPHGALCATLLPHVMEKNIEAMAAAGASLDRYDAVARLVTGNPVAKAQQGTEWVQALVTKLGIPRLGTYGVRETDFPAIVENATRASSMKANPVPLSAVQLREILEAAF